MSQLSVMLKKRSPVINVLTPEQTAAEAVRTMSEQEVGAVLIVEGGQLIGIFSERDLVRRVVAKGKALENTTLRQVMTADPITANPSDTRKSALVKMQTLGCRHLPILMDGQLVDMISIRDLLFDEIKERDSEIDELKRYIQGARGP